MILGLSTNGKVIDERFFISCEENGIKIVELSMTKEGYDNLDFGTVARYASEHDVFIRNLHLPFYPFDEINIASEDSAVRDHTLSVCRDLITKGTNIGITHFIIHPSGEPNPDASRAVHIGYAKDSLKRLTAFAGERNAVICVEDLPRTCLGNCSDDILELISADDRLRVCFDTNHLLSESAESFISKVGNLIASTHVSDYDFVDEKHWLPGEGSVDWLQLIKHLKTAGYDGPWLYEVAFKTPSTITRSRDLTCKDFADNYNALMTGRIPERIS